jgi:predicted O-linked N-acetylglucosamine transferase (SPINDLY family)
MKLFAGLIRDIDPACFEVHLFHPGGKPDSVTESLRSGAASYQDGPATLGEWARRIMARDLDVLVYTDVGLDGFGAALAAIRLAPLQAVLWGHPVTTGLKNIDLFFSSDAMEPADGETHYRERLIRLPGLGATPTPPTHEPMRPAGLPLRSDHEVTAFMPQMLKKFDIDFDRVMARIAAACPHLRFILTPFMHRRPTRAWLRRLDSAFREAGSNLGQHLRLCGALKEREWLGLVRESDFGLDSFRWSGGGTSLEMFWHDTPIVTLPGTLMRGRHTLAMLRIMELPELIANDENDYVRIAVELASSADFRTDMRGRIAERKHRLFDGTKVKAAFAQHLVDEVAKVRAGADT